jgi:hypothetical protein
VAQKHAGACKTAHKRKHVRLFKARGTQRRRKTKASFDFHIAAFGKIFQKNAKRSACLRYIIFLQLVALNYVLWIQLIKAKEDKLPQGQNLMAFCD